MVAGVESSRLSFGGGVVMLGSVRAIFERFRSPATKGDGDESPPKRADGGTVGGTAAGRSTGDAAASSLYECPSCARVFVAVEKGTCGTCDAAVDEVARTN